MNYKMVSIFLLLIWVLSFGVTAQDDDSACPTIVEEALVAVSELCAETGRNEACYGNSTLLAVPQPGITDLRFENPGDITDVAKIASLNLSDLDEGVPEWGVAMMRLQANLPDTMPGQNVTFLLFGDVELQTTRGFPVTVNAAGTINVRAEPSTASPVVGQLSPTTVVTATGRTEAGDWLQVTLPNNDGTGWVAAFLLTFEDDVLTLDPVTAGESNQALQAFYIRSGVGEMACAEAPRSGIMIQTPTGVAKAELVINAVHIELGSTAYLQGEIGESLSLYTLEGEARVTAFDEVRGVPAGARVSVPIDSDLAVAGPPGAAEPYTVEDVAPLAAPVRVLPEPITIADPFNRDGGATTLHPDGCEPAELHAGIITLFFGVGGDANGPFNSCDELDARVEGTASLAIDGMSPYNYTRTCINLDSGTMGGHTTAEIMLGPGVYTYSGTWHGQDRSCTITVLP